MRVIVDTLRRPEVWALSFYVVASEASMFNAPADGSGFPSALAPWIIVSLLVYLALFVFADRIRTLRGRSWLIPCVTAVGILGLCLRAASGFDDGLSPFYLVGDGSLGISIIVLGYISIERLVDLSLVWTIRSIVASSVINALVVPLYHASEFWSVAVSLAICALSLWVAERAPVTVEHPTCSPTRFAPSFPKGLAVGFLVLAACFGFLQSFLYLENATTIEVVVAATKLVAVVAFGLVIFRMEDTGYSLLAKMIATISIAALVVFLSFGRTSVVSMSLMATGYSLLEITYLLIMVNVAATRYSPIKVISVFYLIDTVGYALGVTMSDFANEWSAEVPISMVLVILLATAAIWLFDEKRINSFLWSESLDKESSHVLNFEDKTVLLAKAYKLSPRETEVLKLFASGRSAAFIAEATFVSSNTVRTHIKHIYAKCDVHSRQELITRIEQQSA